MTKSIRTRRRSRWSIAPSIDQLESRQLLSAAPVRFQGESLRHHRAAVVEEARHAHYPTARMAAASHSAEMRAAAVEARGRWTRALDRYVKAR
jgi:hypothetical protein